MKPMRIGFAVCFVWIVMMLPAFADGRPPQEGETLPEITLLNPGNQQWEEYLGIAGKRSISIPEIKADVVIVEIFSMYCPFCQREAPAVNALYQSINDTMDLKDKVKLIGIGAGNSPFEVNFFRETYHIPFPLFSDGDFSIHQKIGQVRTPYFIGIRIHPDGTHRIIYSKGGGFKDTDQFLHLILRRAGLLSDREVSRP